MEAGKRLAAISREAKERKARQQSKAEAAMESKQKEISKLVHFAHYIDWRFLFAGVGAVAAVGGLYFAFTKNKREEQEEKIEEKEVKKPNNNTNNNRKNLCENRFVKSLDSID